MNLKRSVLTIGLLTLAAPLAWGQAANPPELYTGSFGGGLALTGGNTDTKNFNLTFAFVRDPKTKNVIKSSATYLRGSQTKGTNLDRSTVNLRDEYTVSGRTFVFGQVDHLRDPFKGIIFQWGPSGGVGYKLINTDDTFARPSLPFFSAQRISASRSPTSVISGTVFCRLPATSPN